MKTPLIAIAFLVFLSGIIFSKAYISKKSKDLNDLLSQKQEVMGDKDEEEESVSQPTTTITATPTTSPTITARAQVNILSSYKYPNSEIALSNDNQLKLYSTDHENVITDWYKEKIKESGMNIRTFVVTKTGGNVLNKLVGGDGESELRVEISKNGQDSKVEISVYYQSK